MVFVIFHQFQQTRARNTNLELLLIIVKCYTLSFDSPDGAYHIVKNFGSKKVWRKRTVGSLAEKTLANLSSFV